MSNCSVLESHQKSTDKPTRRIKRSGGHSLVRHNRAEWIIENILLRMLPIAIVSKIPHNSVRMPYKPPVAENEPSQSPRMAKLRWEPPKSKRQLKAHPW